MSKGAAREAIVSRIVDEGCGARTLRLDFSEPFSFQAGQRVDVALPGEAGFPCLICSSPLQTGMLEVSFRSEARAARRLRELRGGETVLAQGPMGDWTYRDDAKSSVFLAQGAGIAPCRSMIRYALEKGLPASLALVYSEKSSSCMLFRTELEEFARNGVAVLVALDEPDAAGSAAAPGPITADLLRRSLGRLKQRTYFLAGKAPFLEDMRRLLGRAGVEPGQVFADEAAPD